MIKLTFKEYHKPPFDCDDCGTCFPEHWTISITKDNGEEHLLYELDHDGHMGGFQTEGDIMVLMRDALWAMCSGAMIKGDYEARSIDYCYEQCKEFADGLYSEWRKVKAYALALEDDGWEIEVEEELCK